MLIISANGICEPKSLPGLIACPNGSIKADALNSKLVGNVCAAETVIGILGYGCIGHVLAWLAKPRGVIILVTKPDARQLQDIGVFITGQSEPEGVLPHRIYPSEAIRSMIDEYDFVFIMLPLIKCTHY